MCIRDRGVFGLEIAYRDSFLSLGKQVKLFWGVVKNTAYDDSFIAGLESSMKRLSAAYGINFDFWINFERNFNTRRTNVKRLFKAHMRKVSTKVKSLFARSWKWLPKESHKTAIMLAAPFMLAGQYLQEQIPELGTALQTALDGAWSWAVNRYAPSGSGVWGSIGDVLWNSTSAVAASWGEALRILLDATGEWLRGNPPRWDQVLIDILDAAWDGINEVSFAWGYVLGQLYLEAYKWLLAHPSDVSTILLEILKKAWSVHTEAYIAVGVALEEIHEGAVAWLNGRRPTWVWNLIDIWETTLKGIASVASDWGTIFKDWVEDAWGWVEDNLNLDDIDWPELPRFDLGWDIAEVFSNIGTSITNAWNTYLLPSFNSLITNLQGAWSSVWNGLFSIDTSRFSANVQQRAMKHNAQDALNVMTGIHSQFTDQISDMEESDRKKFDTHALQQGVIEKYKGNLSWLDNEIGKLQSFLADGERPEGQEGAWQLSPDLAKRMESAFGSDMALAQETLAEWQKKRDSFASQISLLQDKDHLTGLHGMQNYYADAVSGARIWNEEIQEMQSFLADGERPEGHEGAWQLAPELIKQIETNFGTNIPSRFYILAWFDELSSPFADGLEKFWSTVQSAFSTAETHIQKAWDDFWNFLTALNPWKDKESLAEEFSPYAGSDMVSEDIWPTIPQFVLGWDPMLVFGGIAMQIHKGWTWMTDTIQNLWQGKSEEELQAELDELNQQIEVNRQAVSYTHLTLPTICSV